MKTFYVLSLARYKFGCITRFLFTWLVLSIPGHAQRLRVLHDAGVVDLYVIVDVRREGNDVGAQ